MTEQLPTSDNETYDNTRISAYKTCPRSYFIRHVLKWTGDGTSPALVFGSSWHAGMDAVWGYAKGNTQSQLTELAMLSFYQKWEEEGLERDMDLSEMESMGARTPMIAHEMYHNYVKQRWSMLQECTLIAGEQPFAVPMPGHDDTWYIGRLDKSIRFNAQNLVLEHKTTSLYRIQGNFDPMYVDSWYSSSQVKGYEFAGTLYYGDLGGVWVDAALVHKKVHDAFKFIPVKHNTDLLTEWVWDTQQWIARIKNDVAAFKSAGRLEPGVFPRNEESCFGKYGTCPFLDICRTCSDPSRLDSVPAGYQESEWNPFDVLGLAKLVEEKQQ